MQHLGVQQDADVVRRWMTPAPPVDGPVRVVDAGCGTGPLIRALAGPGVQVLGIEPHPRQRARAIAEGLPEGAEVRAGGAEAMPVPDGWAHLVVFNRSLHHVPVPLQAAALRDAERVLARRGAVVVAEPDPEGSWSTLLEPFHDERAVRAAAQQAVAEAAPRFTEVTELTYDRHVTFASIEAFYTWVCDVSYLDVDEDRLRGPEVRARFEAGRTAQGDHRFVNHIRVHGLVRAGSPP